jgi:hypothetical protein
VSLQQIDARTFWDDEIQSSGNRSHSLMLTSPHSTSIAQSKVTWAIQLLSQYHRLESAAYKLRAMNGHWKWNTGRF